jgi:hypothetical protein
VKEIILMLAFAGLATLAVTPAALANEDSSRFREQPYKKADIGMLSPSGYIALAKQAVHRQYKNVNLNNFFDPFVTRRFYQDAPSADRDVICVRFVYAASPSGGGLIGPGFIYQRGPSSLPVIQALIRRDGSKIYLTVQQVTDARNSPHYQ